MELSNAEVIKSLTEPTLPLRKDAPPKLPRRVMSRRCACGRCATCLDNARWEQIFQAKFADPTYYLRRPLQRGSSLHGLA